MSTTWRTLKELDGALGRPKGTAFRAFKRFEPSWSEGSDYRVLHPEHDAAEIEALRAAGRVYRASRAVILISEDAAARIGS